MILISDKVTDLEDHRISTQHPHFSQASALLELEYPAGNNNGSCELDLMELYRMHVHRNY